MSKEDVYIFDRIGSYSLKAQFRLLCTVMQTSLDCWHRMSVTYPLQEELKSAFILNLAYQLSYHHYCLWHQSEEFIENKNSESVRQAVIASTYNNKTRSQVVEKLDEIFCKRQKGTGKVNSETLGSILDRLCILYIKKLHLVDSKDSRLTLVEKQIEVLESCADELADEMESGERQVFFVCSRFKLW